MAPEEDWLDALDREEEEALRDGPEEARGRRGLPARPNDRSISPALPRGRPEEALVKVAPIAFEFDLPSRSRNADAWMEHQRARKPNRDLEGMRERMTKIFQGEQSFSRRTIDVLSEDSNHTLRLCGTVSTTVREVKEIVAGMTRRPIQSLRIVKKQGAYWRHEHDFNEVSSKVRVLGAPTFERLRHSFSRPLVIIGAGFGGITSACQLLRAGQDFVIFERRNDYGGQSWMGIANRQTKLQTEAGTYHVNFPYPECVMPAYMPVWPSRDHLLVMFRREARKIGLEALTRFNTEVNRVFLKGHQESTQRYYNVKYQDARSEDAPEQDMLAGAVITWPGNLCAHREVTFQNEFAFGGYIAYASCNLCDYTQVSAKTVLLYGHGAFAIENVRTLAEYEAAKIWILCRRRNLTAPKMGSWLISQTNEAASAPKLLQIFKPAYDLVGFDPWTAHSVIANAERTKARIATTTVFGVTDVYFIACYYGKAEVVVGDVKRLSRHCVHLESGRKLEAECVLKVCGIHGDPKVDRVLGITEMVGLWVNGDAFRPCVANGIGVNAQNFESFSTGPGISGNSILIHYILDFPEDLTPLLESLPACTAGERPAYDVSGQHSLTTHFISLAGCPGLGLRSAHLKPMKSAKQHAFHPLRIFMEECKREWQMYIEMFGHEFPDKPPPPYPYSEESVLKFMEEIVEEGRAKAGEAWLRREQKG